MTAILKRVEDPRDALERARRPELVAYARANGMPEVSADMPAMLIRPLLRQRGLTRPPIPNRILGVPDRGPDLTASTPPGTTGPEVDAIADLARQFALPAVSVPPAGPAGQAPSADAVDRMTIIELGKEMQRLNIKRDRRDNMVTMRAKIKAHG